MPTSATLDYTAPISRIRGGIWLQRGVGAISAMAGVLGGALACYGAYRVHLRGSGIELPVFGFLAALVVLAAFFLTSGMRLVLNRPNEYNSLLSPVAWYITAALFFVGGWFLVVQHLQSGGSYTLLRPLPA